MALKDLFNEDEAINFIAKQSMVSASKEVESPDYIVEFNKDKNRYIPQVDYSDPANFAFYGSAEEYYERSFVQIRDEYPYDGSNKEKMVWRNEATYLDLYLFDHVYPRTNGHISLHRNGYGTLSAGVFFKGGTYGMSSRSTGEYILFKGGPNVDNVYNVSKNREENLKLDLTDSGVTVEFWADIARLAPTLAVSGVAGNDSPVIFDLWNGQTTGGTDYGRFTIGINNIELSGTSAFYVHLNSGSTGGLYESGSGGAFSSWVAADIERTGWHHYAFTAFNSGSDLKFELFVDGQIKQTSTTAGQAIGSITGSMIATLGAAVAYPDWLLQAPGTVAAPLGRGYGSFSGSLDEFRFWKTRRTPKQVGRYYRSQVGGGTNTDDPNTDLGVYYKFNEGITTNVTTDAIVLDYSGRVSNGAWTNYSSGARLTSSAIVEVGAATYEFQDPIIRSGHPTLSASMFANMYTGSVHDTQNNSMLYHSYPTWIIEEDEANEGNLKIMSQIVGSYFDSLHLQIDNYKNLRTKSYVSASHKPQPHANRLLTSVGFVAPNIFVDAEVIEQFEKRSETVLFQDDLHNIKNTIYQNIYNNIDYIYKTKGTEKSFRNLLRCYGVDDELIKFNLYANGATHDLKTNYDVVSVKKNFADFNDPDRNAALIYQTSSMAGTAVGERYFQTTECEVRFPNKKKSGELSYYWFPHVSSSLFGALASGSNVSGGFGVYAVRDRIDSEDVKFVFSSSFGFLTSSVYRSTYDNQQWNFAVKVKPQKPKADLTSFGDLAYNFEFTGLNTIAGTTINEFTVSQSIGSAYVDDVLGTKKRLYVGAARSSISGAIVQRSDVRISSMRHWLSEITNKELLEHAKHPFNLGVEHPYEDVGTTLSAVINVPKIETLTTAWDFQSSSLPDANGMFATQDFSSGSTAGQSLYGIIGSISKKKYDGVGRFYSVGDSGSVDRDFVSALKPRLPESLNSLDMISIGEDQDKIFTKDSRPVDYFWAFEKSMSQTISEEILSFFATINDFNTLIGAPVNRYRPEYKELQKLRQLFFQRFETEIDYERYTSFYKWIDSSINMMLEKLIPLSANTSERVRNVIESHVLERAKIWTKFPTMELKQKDPEVAFEGAKSFRYNWKFGHAPVGGLAEDQNIYWWKARAKRDGVLTSGDAVLDASRELTKQVIHTETTASHPKFYDQRTSATYGGSTYALRNARPYTFAVDLMDVEARRADPMLLDAMLNVGTVAAITSTTTYKRTENDEQFPQEFRESKEPDAVAVGLTLSGVALDIQSARKFLPFNLVSSSVPSGVTVTFNNLHRDEYGSEQSTVMQGPFTEKFVGGHPVRHTELTVDPNSLQDDLRAERWLINIGAGIWIDKHPRSAAFGGKDSPPSNWYRDGMAKRPLNIANIQYTTSSDNQIGNFQNNYEVVQSSGRTENNFWFRNGVLSSSVQQSTTVSGVMDFTLPSRGRQKSIIVERFSAPGEPATLSRGYLDTEAEEFSVYNQLNYRNLSVRTPLQTLLTKHTAQFGLNPDSPLSASFHKSHRNGLTRVEYSTNRTVVSSSQYDNANIRHQIPRSDRQYAWITGSMKSWSPNGISSTN